MRVAPYITQETLSAKSQEWLEKIRPFYYDREHFSFDPSRAALLVIDMQRYFVAPEGRASLPAAQAILPGLRQLIDTFSAAKNPIFWTRHGHQGQHDLGVLGRFWGDYIRYGEEQWEIAPEVAPHPEHIVIDKTRYDAFWETGLAPLFKERRVEQVVITGVMTHLCCETTARTAFVRDYEVYFAIDGTATSSEEHHLSTLRNLANGFAVPVTIEQLLASFPPPPQEDAPSGNGI
jgi:isochorismate hydrolase